MIVITIARSIHYIQYISIKLFKKNEQEKTECIKKKKKKNSDTRVK